MAPHKKPATKHSAKAPTKGDLRKAKEKVATKLRRDKTAKSDKVAKADGKRHRERTAKPRDGKDRSHEKGARSSSKLPLKKNRKEKNKKRKGG